MFTKSTIKKNLIPTIQKLETKLILISKNVNNILLICNKNIAVSFWNLGPKETTSSCIS